MKIGSLVECVGPIDYKSVHKMAKVDIHVGAIYTVNWIDGFDGDRLGFEETSQNQCYAAEYFREIIFPEDLMSQVTEALDRELVLADKI